MDAAMEAGRAWAGREQYFRYWGKAARPADGPSYENYDLLVYHSLDVAAVGRALLDHNHGLRRGLCHLLGLAERDCIALTTLLLGLHDIGKFSEAFQGVRPDLFCRLRGQTPTEAYSVRHDSLGQVAWEDRLSAFAFDAGPLGAGVPDSGRQLICTPDNEDPSHLPFAVDPDEQALSEVLVGRVVWWANEDP